jgi:hypothetical protein
MPRTTPIRRAVAERVAAGAAWVVVTLTCEAREGTDTARIERTAWDAMTPQQRARLLDQIALEHVTNQGGYGWDIADPADLAAVGWPPADPCRELADWLAGLTPPVISSSANATFAEAIRRAREALGGGGAS